MRDETISRAQVLLQYYSALAELEGESRLIGAPAVMPAHANLRAAGHRQQMLPPIVVPQEVRVSA